jgi:hypothetical protein
MIFTTIFSGFGRLESLPYRPLTIAFGGVRLEDRFQPS